MLDPCLDIVIDTTLLVNGCDDRSSAGLIQNGCRSGGHIRLEPLLEVERELGVCEEVRIPVAPARGSPGDVDLPLAMVEPYLDAAGLSGCPASRGDVDHAALFQRVLYLCIHTSSPVVMASVMEAIRYATL